MGMGMHCHYGGDLLKFSELHENILRHMMLVYEMLHFLFFTFFLSDEHLRREMYLVT